jgi:hypothetical protein
MSMTKHPNSRWHARTTASRVPRYDAETLTLILKRYRERKGFARGARVTRHLADNKLVRQAA